MKISVVARHFELTEDIRQYIAKKLEKVETFYDRIIEVNAILTLERHRYTVELDAFAKKTTLHAEVEMHELQAAIDSAVEKINRQSQKFKERVKIKRRRTSIAGMAETMASTSSEKLMERLSESAELSGLSELSDSSRSVRSIGLESESDAESLQIVRSSKFAPKPMAPEEAALQLRLSKDTFLVFLNAQSSQLNVIYKKRNGSFGWIEPE